MHDKVKPGLAVGAVLLAALGGGGAAALAGDSGGPSASRALDRQTLLEEAASRLGVEPAELRRALLGALTEELDEAVAQGRLTEAQAERIRERARSRSGLPLLRPGGRGFGHGHGPRLALLDEAAAYLEMPVSELRRLLRRGRSLADVASDEGKSVDGLSEALVDAAREQLQERVDAGEIPQERADRLIRRLSERIDALVEGRFRGFRRHGWGGGNRG
jgi:hypothetical protein